MMNRQLLAFADETIASACNWDNNIVAAFKSVDRALFIDEALRFKAYKDFAMPIGQGQTISQPSLVAMMLSELECSKSHSCLEIGAGSGFVTALLSKLVNKVYAVELLDEFVRLAEKRLKLLAADNAMIICGDGSVGLQEYAPYDRIIVSAKANNIPPSLKRQLKFGGIMLIPVGDELIKCVKTAYGLTETVLANVNFVEFKNS
jgi:protein-L-isoaspartate(D-aspartate) O-methyltransferase